MDQQPTSISEQDKRRLTGFFTDLITYCDREVRSLRKSVELDLKHAADAKAKDHILGRYTIDECWKVYAPDELIRIVRDLDDLTGDRIGFAPPIRNDEDRP